MSQEETREYFASERGIGETGQASAVHKKGDCSMDTGLQPDAPTREDKRYTSQGRFCLRLKEYAGFYKQCS